MINAYLDVVYPLVVIAAGILAVAGVGTMIAIGMHRALTWVVTGFYVVTAVEVVVVIGAMLTSDAAIVMTSGYVLAAIALLPLLGVGRLGSPEAAQSEPGRPVLQPDQIARVDGGAAVIVAIAAAVVAWRVAVILGAAA